ncbi:MAG: hypothetical protein ACRD6X_19575, partial [Pyrinomonadaceae bacterium]
MQPETQIYNAMIQECEPRISQIYTRLNTEQPNFGVKEECFAASVKKTAAKYLFADHDAVISSDQIEQFLEQLQAEDLYLALACANGNERAWWEFDQQHRSYLERVARHLAKTDVDAQEVLDTVYV